jgi:hypothetical protein
VAWVHGATDVVHRRIAHDLQSPELRLDLHFNYLAAIRKLRRADRLIGHGRERAAQLFRQVGKLVYRACDVRKLHLATACSHEFAVSKLHRIRLALEQQCGDALSFFDDLLRRAPDHDAGQPQAPP